MTKDTVAKSTMVDAQKEVDHKKELFPIERKSPSFEAQNPLEEINIETSNKLRMTKVSGLLAEKDKNWHIELITKYKDFFFLRTIMRC